MKYFVDTEFHAPGAGKPITLISIAVVREDGKDFYGIQHGFDWENAPQWLKDNVLPTVYSPTPSNGAGGPREYLAKHLRDFIGDDTPEFWGYYCAFDYVVLSQLMGGMDEWPEGWPYMMYDLRQWLDHRGLQAVMQPTDSEHNALKDAQWVRGVYAKYSLME